jgi:hypothetical protein
MFLQVFEMRYILKSKLPLIRIYKISCRLLLVCLNFYQTKHFAYKIKYNFIIIFIFWIFEISDRNLGLFYFAYRMNRGHFRNPFIFAFTKIRD